MKQQKKIEGLFEYVVLSGTSYEIGQQQAQLLSNEPSTVGFFLSRTPEGYELNSKELEDHQAYFDKFCPGINMELQGFADYFGVPVNKVVYYAFSCNIKGGCSQFIALPKITENNHVLVGRNYEYYIEDELRLCTTNVDGKYSHIGFSLLLFGRYDGMNEKGLSVTMSNPVMGSEPNSKGLKFWAIFRTILENFETSFQALDYLKSINISDNMIFLIADKNGCAMKLENACENYEVKMIDQSAAENYLCATNHYTLDSMQKFNSYPTKHSYDRMKIIQEFLERNSNNLKEDDFKKILTQPMPDGVFCPYYTGEMGTLWSIVFNLSTCTANVCFGSYINKWYQFSFNNALQNKHYPVIFTDLPTPEFFWDNLSDNIYNINLSNNKI